MFDVGIYFFNFWSRPLKMEEDLSHCPDAEEEKPETLPEKVRMDSA